MQHLQSLASPHLGFNIELIHLSLWGRYSLLFLCYLNRDALTHPLKMPPRQLSAAGSESWYNIQHPTVTSHSQRLTLPRIHDSSRERTLLLDVTVPLAGHCSPSKTQLMALGHHFCWWSTIWIRMSTCHNQKDSSVYWNCSFSPTVVLLNAHTQTHF